MPPVLRPDAWSHFAAAFRASREPKCSRCSRAFWEMEPDRYVEMASDAASRIAARPPLAGPRVLLTGAPVDGHDAARGHRIARRRRRWRSRPVGKRRRGRRRAHRRRSDRRARRQVSSRLDRRAHTGRLAARAGPSACSTTSMPSSCRCRRTTRCSAGTIRRCAICCRRVAFRTSVCAAIRTSRRRLPITQRSTRWCRAASRLQEARHG